MATLTETAYYSRKSIQWGIIGLIIFFILKFLFGMAIDVWRKTFPPAPPPPTVAFGKLPALKFPSGASPSANLTYKLETIEGAPSVASSTANVFFISKPSANLLSFSRAKQFASKLGFYSEPESENATTYRWQDNLNPLRVLKMNIVNGNFKMTYDYSLDISLFTEKNLPTKDKAITEASEYLKELSLFPTTLNNGKTAVSYWQLSGNNLILTTSMSNADAVRVDFSRENILNLPLFSANHPYEPIYFLFSGNTDASKRILELSYYFWQIDNYQQATYPLKSAANAWDELRSGKSFIINIGQNATSITIRKIYLAYYYPADYQEFLQPIYVFEGDPNFLAYISAVNPTWVGQ
ncbi:MAG: hypothetical protein V1858_03465 [Candidatus Gottesmanbacteria bacterium]